MTKLNWDQRPTNAQTREQLLLLLVLTGLYEWWCCECPCRSSHDEEEGNVTDVVRECAWSRDSLEGCSSSPWHLPTHKALSEAIQQPVFCTGETQSSPGACQQGLQQGIQWVCLLRWPFNHGTWYRFLIVLQNQRNYCCLLLFTTPLNLSWFVLAP